MFFTSITKGSSEENISKTWSIITPSSNATLGAGQFLSPSLVAQTVPSMNLLISFAAQVNVSLGQTWECWCGLYLINGSTGAIRTTLFDNELIPGTVTGRTSDLQTSVFSNSLTAAEWTSVAGDYLALEIGFNYFT